MFAITALGALTDPQAALFLAGGLPAPAPFVGPNGAYLGHEWSRWRRDALDARVDAWLEHRARRARILDLGCATGERAAAFARAGHRVTAADCLDQAAAIAERNAALRSEAGTGDPITFVRLDLRDPAAFVAWETFDLIHMRRVINFVTLVELAACLTAVSRSLEENGRFVASFIATGIRDAAEMTAAAPHGVAGGTQLHPGFHAHRFGDVVGILERHGFDVVEAFSDWTIEAGLMARKRQPDRPCVNGTR